MNTRTSRSRRSFLLESLEVRNAPSHFGGLAHAALAIHKAHVPAQVRHFNDTQAHDKVSSLDKSSGVERSPDTNVESNSNDPNGIDTSPKDQSRVDSSGQS
jgi:hypothetical protein